MVKTSTQHNFEIDIKDMMNLIESQSVKIKDAKHLVMRCINLLERYNQVRISRDKWRVRAEAAEKKLKDLKDDK